jgi:hypothetical protein
MTVCDAKMNVSALVIDSTAAKETQQMAAKITMSE